MKENSTWEKIEEVSREQRVHDRAVILNASMQGVKTELKTLAGKRTHPFALENMQNNNN